MGCTSRNKATWEINSGGEHPALCPSRSHLGTHVHLEKSRCLWSSLWGGKTGRAPGDADWIAERSGAHWEKRRGAPCSRSHPLRWWKETRDQVLAVSPWGSRERHGFLQGTRTFLKEEQSLLTLDLDFPRAAGILSSLLPAHSWRRAQHWEGGPEGEEKPWGCGATGSAHSLWAHTLLTHTHRGAKSIVWNIPAPSQQQRGAAANSIYARDHGRRPVRRQWKGPGAVERPPCARGRPRGWRGSSQSGCSRVSSVPAGRTGPHRAQHELRPLLWRNQDLSREGGAGVGGGLSEAAPEPQRDCSAPVSHLGAGRKALWAELQLVQEPCGRPTLGVWRGESGREQREGAGKWWAWGDWGQQGLGHEASDKQRGTDLITVRCGEEW